MSYTPQSHVATGDQATAILQNILLDNVQYLHDSLFANDFRLSLDSTFATADTSDSTTLYCNQVGNGNRISLMDGSGVFTVYTSSNFSTAIPAVANKMYDIFCYASSGTPTLELLAWTSDLVRATSLAMTNGVWHKSGDTTRLYLGSIRTLASGHSSDIYYNRLLWNKYNQRYRRLVLQYAGASYTYSTATLRAVAGGSTAGAAFIGAVFGIGDDFELDLTLSVIAESTSASTVAVAVIGENATTEHNALVQEGCLLNFDTANIFHKANGRALPVANLAPGYREFWWLEIASGTGTVTWTPAVVMIAGSVNEPGIYGVMRG